MLLGEACNREVIITDSSCTVLKAAKLMREYHVGSIVIIKKEQEINKPIGIITDRDIVIEVISKNTIPDMVKLSEIMSTELVTGKDTDELWASLQNMRTHGVRRMPVIDKNGSLVGIITADDILELFSEELQDVIRLIAVEQEKEGALT